MIILAVICTSALLGALFVLAFYMGMRYEQTKPKQEDAYTVSDLNKDAFMDVARWFNYGGKR